MPTELVELEQLHVEQAVNIFTPQLHTLQMMKGK